MLAAGRTMSFLKAQAKQARAQLEGFAVQYAGGMKSSHPELTQFLVARMKQNFDAGRFDDALKDLPAIQRAYPLDPVVLYYHACCMRAIGDLTTAREEFTRHLDGKDGLRGRLFGAGACQSSARESLAPEATCSTAQGMAPPTPTRCGRNLRRNWRLASQIPQAPIFRCFTRLS